ncbi:MAG: class I SAM-dependent methyltransferase, partial [Anaerolineaceae bacterium]|nr:class I SAM-dependent methyltransferase [Anaerolineaceae bacterium]
MLSKSKDFLWLNIRELPYFRGLLRAVEARFYQDTVLESPVLDLGCGDGTFSKITFDKTLDVGLDTWAGSLRSARDSKRYKIIVQASGTEIPFPAKHFQSIISNSVLEHITDVDSVLSEAARILKPGGVFLFCVPNQNFLPNLSVSALLDRFGIKFLAELYRTFFNKISRHYHCDPPNVWEKRLINVGFVIEEYWNYFSPSALHVLEWGHYFGLPSLVAHWIFGRWILIPKGWNLAVTKKLLHKYYLED